MAVRCGITLSVTALAALAFVLTAPAMALAGEVLANNSATVVNQTGVRQRVFQRLFDAPGTVYARPWFEDGDEAHRLQIVAENAHGNYDFDFGAPQGQQLHVGEYTGATRDFGTEGPVLEVTGEGGCNQSYGRFIVKDIDINGAGEVDRFWALYERHCENPNAPAMFGEVRVGEPATSAPEAIEPSVVEWPRTWVGETSVGVPVTVIAGQSGADVTSVALAGEDPGDFRIASDECLHLALAPGERCQLEVAAAPAAPGNRAAELLVTDSSGSETAIPLAVAAEPALKVNYATLVSESGSWVGEGSDYLFDEPREVSMDPALGGGVFISSESETESASFEFQPIEEGCWKRANTTVLCAPASSRKPALGSPPRTADTAATRRAGASRSRTWTGTEPVKSIVSARSTKSTAKARGPRSLRRSERGRACDRRARGRSPCGNRMAERAGRYSDRAGSRHRRRGRSRRRGPERLP